MADEKKLIESITKDLTLVSRTAVALAQKLDSLNKNLNQLFEQLDIEARIERTSVQTVSQGQTQAQAQPTQVKQGKKVAQQRQPARSKPKGWDSDMADKGISSILNKIGKLVEERANPELISFEMEKARDSLMGISKKHSPVFAEIGRRAREIRNLKTIDENTKKELLETIINWRSRLLSA